LLDAINQYYLEIFKLAFYPPLKDFIEFYYGIMLKRKLIVEPEDLAEKQKVLHHLKAGRRRNNSSIS